MSYELSRGAIEEIMSGTIVDRPVFQLLGQKKIAGSGGSDRFRLLLSDGIYSHSSAMLATQLNNMVTDGELDTFAIVRLDKYICNTIQPDRRVIIVLEVSIIASGPTVNQKLGNPQPLKNVGGQGGGAAPEANTASDQQKPKSNGSAMPNGHGSANGSAPTTPARKAPAFGNVRGMPNPPNTPGGSISKVHPISSLTPYQNRWCIKARVTNKGSLRTYSNSRGEGKLFNVNLLDDSGEIRATAFNREVDKFFDMIELNKVYYIRKASLKTANKQYSSLNNDYEMTFNGETEVIPCDDDADLPSVSFNFVPINQLETHAANSTVDVIGVVKNVADLSTVTGRQSNKEIKKRDIQLVDENQVMVRMTLWGSDAESFSGVDNPVLAVKGCRLSDWGGRSLSALASSQIILNPDIPEAHQVKGWYDSVGHSVDFNEFRSEGQGAGGAGGYVTNWKTFGEVKAQNLGQDKADYFTAKGTVVVLRKENCMYMACPQQDCNKKLVDQANGHYRCEKCQKEFPNYKWRLILSANLSDYTDNQWVTCFQETAETLLGKSGDELGRLKEQDEVAFDQTFTDANFKSYIFRLRAKMETYNDESRLKTVCVGATPVDHADYNKKLVENIEKLLSGQ